jgi:hypothetical protein
MPGMTPVVLSLIVSAMPLAIAAFAAFSAWAEWRPDFAQPYRLHTLVVDAVADIDDDRTFFQ